MSKEKEDQIVSEITNRKLYAEVAQAMSGIDSSARRDGAAFFIKFPAEAADLKKAVVEYQVQVYDKAYWSCNICAFCLPEVLAVVSGSLKLVGIRPGDIDGPTTTGKLDKLTDMPFSEALPMAQQNGFIVNVAAKQAIAIPPGMFVATLGSTTEATVMIRWSFMRACDYEVVHGLLTRMVQDLPHMAASDYSTLMSLMEASKKRRADASDA